MSGEIQAINSACCRLFELSKDERLTEIERKMFKAAWWAALDASKLVVTRTNKEAAE